MHPSDIHPSLTSRVSLAAAAGVVAVAFLVLLIGWIVGSDTLVRLRAVYAAMVPSTALCFISLGTGLLGYWLQGSQSRNLTLSLSVVVAVISGADLVMLAGGLSDGIDSLLWPSLIAPGDAMAFATGASFLLGSYCLAALASPRLMSVPIFVGAGTVGLLAALVAVVGYMFDAQALYGVFVFTAMALHTAIAFVLLFVALLLSKPEFGWVGILLGNGSGSRAARRLLPGLIVGPLILSLIAFQLTRSGVFTADFRLSLLAIIMIALATGLVLRNASIENGNEQRLLRTMDELEATSADRALLLREVHHRVKNNLQQINALLRVEGRKSDNPEVVNSFRAMAERVQAIGMVHQLLIAAPKPSQVQASDFLTKLVQNVSAGHDLKRRGIEVQTEIIEELLHLDLAISIGLLVNELLANAIKHAYPNGKTGTIKVAYRYGEEGFVEIVVTDDGVGYSSGDEEGRGTGSTIIRSLVTQLEASMTVNQVDGTEVIVRLPDDINKRGRYG